MRIYLVVTFLASQTITSDIKINKNNKSIRTFGEKKIKKICDQIELGKIIYKKQMNYY